MVLHMGSQSETVKKGGGITEFLTYLVANSFGPAPVQEDLLDAAGTGNCKTLGSLEFGPAHTLPPAQRGTQREEIATVI